MREVGGKHIITISCVHGVNKMPCSYSGSKDSLFRQVYQEWRVRQSGPGKSRQVIQDFEVLVLFQPVVLLAQVQSHGVLKLWLGCALLFVP